MTRHPHLLAAVTGFLFLLQAGGALAQGDATGPGNGPDVAAPATSGNPALSAPEESGTPAVSIQSALGRYGDPGGIRKYLASKGITYSVTYIAEVLGNTSGGFKRGASFEGLLQPQVDVDLEKLANLQGFAAHASAFNIHGRGLSGNNLLNNFVVSAIEAYPDTLLFEAWAEKKLADGKLFIRAGQIAADTEFMISQTATLFVNSTFGWPTSYGVNLPSGGPAFPIATPGARVKYSPNDKIALLAAVFNGDPAGPFSPGENPITQLRTDGGTAFRLKDAPLLITEAQYAYNQEKDAKGLPGTAKIGYYHHFGSFASNDVPDLNFRGQDSVYGIIDQTIYREKGTTDQGAAVFVRGTLTPSDRGVFDLYFDAGIAYKGLIPGRDDDTVGVAGGYGRISPAIGRQDILAGAAPLIRDYESVLEATYQYAVLPGFSLQPDFQYVFHPGGNGVADTNGLPLRNAAVFGLRATVVY